MFQEKISNKCCVWLFDSFWLISFAYWSYKSLFYNLIGPYSVLCCAHFQNLHILWANWQKFSTFLHILFLSTLTENAFFQIGTNSIVLIHEEENSFETEFFYHLLEKNDDKNPHFCKCSICCLQMAIIHNIYENHLCLKSSKNWTEWYFNFCFFAFLYRFSTLRKY